MIIVQPTKRVVFVYNQKEVILGVLQGYCGKQGSEPEYCIIEEDSGEDHLVCLKTHGQYIFLIDDCNSNFVKISNIAYGTVLQRLNT